MLAQDTSPKPVTAVPSMRPRQGWGAEGPPEPRHGGQCADNLRHSQRRPPGGPGEPRSKGPAKPLMGTPSWTCCPVHTRATGRSLPWPRPGPAVPSLTLRLLRPQRSALLGDHGWWSGLSQLSQLRVTGTQPPSHPDPSSTPGARVPTVLQESREALPHLTSQGWKQTQGGALDACPQGRRGRLAHPPSEGHLHGAREQAQEGLGEKARPSLSSPACHHPHPPSRAKSPKEKPAINKDKRGGAPAECRYTLVCAARAQLGGRGPASTERTVWPTAGPWMSREGEEDEGRVVKHT